MGGTDQDLAEALGVCLRTVRTWKIRHEAFGAAMGVGKEIADTRVEQSLYSKATGYSYPAEKILVVDGAVVCVPYTEHVPPSDVACIFWLKNRKPDQWRDKLDVNATTRPTDMSADPLTNDEWLRMYGRSSTRAS
jgi:hypothetical protein